MATGDRSPRALMRRLQNAAVELQELLGLLAPASSCNPAPGVDLWFDRQKVLVDGLVAAIDEMFTCDMEEYCAHFTAIHLAQLITPPKNRYRRRLCAERAAKLDGAGGDLQKLIHDTFLPFDGELAAFDLS